MCRWLLLHISWHHRHSGRGPWSRTLVWELGKVLRPLVISQVFLCTLYSHGVLATEKVSADHPCCWWHFSSPSVHLNSVLHVRYCRTSGGGTLRPERATSWEATSESFDPKSCLKMASTTLTGDRNRKPALHSPGMPEYWWGFLKVFLLVLAIRCFSTVVTEHWTIA